MNLLSHNAAGAAIHFDEIELRMVMALIQEGRLAFDCKNPRGQALDELFRTAAMLVQDARNGGHEMTSTH